MDIFNVRAYFNINDYNKKKKKTAIENDRLNLSFAKVRVSLIPAILLRYFFHPLFAFLSTG